MSLKEDPLQRVPAHSSIPRLEISGTEEPGGLQLWGIGLDMT